MSASLDELERLVTLLTAEQRKLLDVLRKQRAAMSALGTADMETHTRSAEQVRLRIASIETRRRAIALQAARELKITLAAGEEPTLSQFAAATPDPLRRTRLTVARTELRAVMQDVTAQTHVCSRLSGAVLSHLNGALRLLQSAMRDAGTYTKSGAPRMGARIGAMEIVG